MGERAIRKNHQRINKETRYYMYVFLMYLYIM